MTTQARRFIRPVRTAAVSVPVPGASVEEDMVLRSDGSGASSPGGPVVDVDDEQRPRGVQGSGQ
ncbi:hypothetical protein GCM10010472_66050 [Pseudonocardia halophobica]|uniref:Uncharacterized protein n=1 Tax=Pseudonocardia halophobica TaxID=29401 RepID=A0A9W6UD46_9PSEU|nr:hypothetical protein GCM10017577_68180 [Pseudonocardia halophobica]